MKLSQHEQQVLDEIEQGLEAEDPEFFASMTGPPNHRVGLVRGSVTFLSGLVAFMGGAVLAQAAPGWGVAVSLVGFLALVWGVWLLFPGDRAFPPPGRDSALGQRLGRLWNSMKDPPPGVSP
jgi:hypothetical protein